MEFPDNTFNGHANISAEGRPDDHLAAWLTDLATEYSFKTLAANGDIDSASNPNASEPDADARPRLVVLSTGTGTVAAALPAAADNAGRVITVIRLGANNGTIVPDGADTINGGGTVTLAANFNHRTLFCTGTTWLVIGSS